VAEVEVDEMLRLCSLVSHHCMEGPSTIVQLTMRDKASKVAADDAVPCSTLPAVELRRY